MSALPAGLAHALSDRYRLESELGAGGMATVYLAHDLKHNREVAIKVLRPELAALLGRDRFLAEIRLTARLDHPHILTLLDSGESDGLVWYTLPYIRGESLRQKLQRERQLSLGEALAITQDIASALDYAHQHGVIHRDVKPENILLHEGEAMLADFGIALAVREAGGNRLTETGLSVGTPQYMSPEQATAERQLDARSDIYSLGAVLYEMLAGEPPFTGVTGQAVIAKLMVERPTPLRTVRDTVPAGVEAAVAQALAKVPADRFPSAAAFAAVLAAPEAHRTPRRVPKRVLVAGGIAIAAVALAAVLLLPGLRSSASPVAQGAPTLTPATFSGTAYLPSLSPDGKLLAYASRGSINVENQALGERKVLAEGFSGGLDMLVWSPDQTFLLTQGAKGDPPVEGLYLFSTFGGREEYLGALAGGRFLGSTDTIIAARPGSKMDDANPGLATRWFSLVSRDGRLLDSIPFALPGIVVWPVPSPDGRRVLAWSDQQDFYFIDRRGRLTDSIPRPFRTDLGAKLEWTASGDGVLMLAQDSSGLWNLLRFAVSPGGHVGLPADTVAARLQLPGTPSLSPPARNGDQGIGLWSQTYSIATLERPLPGAPPVRRATLVTGTGKLAASISPDGDRVLVRSSAVLGGNPATQLEVWPFGGGSGSPLGPPRRGPRMAVWGNDGGTIYSLEAGGTTGQLEHVATEIASGRIRRQNLPDSLRWQAWAPTITRDSVLLYLIKGRNADVAGSPREYRTYPPAGGAPLVFSFPDTTAHWHAVILGPDGLGSWYLAAITSGSAQRLSAADTNFTLWIATPGVPAKRAMKFHGPWSDLTLIHAEPGPVLEAVADGGGGRRLLLEPGRPVQDMGPTTLKTYAYNSAFSADGRRGVLMEREDHTDVWLLRWPGQDSARTARTPQ